MLRSRAKLLAVVTTSGAPGADAADDDTTGADDDCTGVVGAGVWVDGDCG